jgi:hypothetical protein
MWISSNFFLTILPIKKTGNHYLLFGLPRVNRRACGEHRRTVEGVKPPGAKGNLVTAKAKPEWRII